MIHLVRNIHPIPQATQAQTTAAAQTSTKAAADPSTDGPSPFQLLFGGQTTHAAPVTATLSNDPPTAESAFGPNPWSANPTGSAFGQSWNYNPEYFATPETAEKVAEMVGGTVVQENGMVQHGPFTQCEPNEMVQLANGNLINPGLVAGFYTHGYSQQMIDQMIANEIKG